MNNKNENIAETNISPYELFCILIGTIIGLGILSLANGVVGKSFQDGWISTIIGSIYPLYIVSVSMLLKRKFPEQNILLLSNKCFGNIIGTILNFIFSIQFLLNICFVTGGVTNTLGIYAVPSVSKYRIIAFCLLAAAYISIGGLKVLIKIDKYAMILIAFLIIIPIFTIGKGSFLNIMPIGGSGLANIIKGSAESAYSYSGIEAILLLYPFVKDKKKFNEWSFITVIFVTLTYSFVVFITIYYLGPNIVNKNIWSFIMVSESVTIPTINNFRYFFTIIWSIIGYKCIASFYYHFVFCFKSIFKNFDIKKIIGIVFFICFGIIIFLGNETKRRMIGDFVIRRFVIFNFSYITIIVLIVYFTKRAYK